MAVAVGKEFGSAFSDRTFKSPLINLLIKSGRNGNVANLILWVAGSEVLLSTIDTGIAGKNNGKGYYIYEKGRKPRPDFTVLPIVEESRRLTNIMPGGKVSLSKKKGLKN